MYYRVAIQVDAQPAWKWQSTALSSLNIVLQWLQIYRAFPQERLRIFSSPERAELNEQLAREMVNKMKSEQVFRPRVSNQREA